MIASFFLKVSKFWHHYRQQSIVAVIVIAVTGGVLGLRSLGVLKPAELKSLDYLFLWRPPEPQDQRIVVIGISEKDIQDRGTRGTWPWTDRIFAQLINQISAAKPAVIGIDKYLDIPVPQNDFEGRSKLIAAMRQAGNVVNATLLVVNDNTQARDIELPSDLAAVSDYGFVNMLTDPDSFARRALLAVDYDSFAFRVAKTYLAKVKNIPVTFDPQSTQFLLKDQVIPRLDRNFGGYVREDAQGYQILINFRGGSGSFPYISSTDILEGKFNPELLRDRIVLVGATALSLKDYYPVIYPSNYSLMFGVEFHANIASQIISAAVDDRPFIQAWSDSVEFLWVLLWASVGAVISWQGRHAGGRARRIPWTAISLVGMGVGIVGIGYGAFLSSWWIPIVPPLLALTISSLTVTGMIARSASVIRKTFGSYLTDEVVASLLDTPEGLKFGGERRKVTILMSDLRGFSGMSERLEPEQVVSILNFYLGKMADVITSYNGTIDEFIGDAILVIFGAPTQRPDDAERAVACAIAMQLAMTEVNEHNDKVGLPKLEMGIGINTGEVVVGNIGSHKRAKYAVVGSNVNLTGRIESYTVGGQTLISEFTFTDIQSTIQSTLRIDNQQVVEPKGVRNPITLYEVGGIGADYNLFLPTAEDALVDLEQKLPIYFTILDGKHVAGNAFLGYLVRLSVTGADLQSEQPLVSLSNIKIIRCDTVKDLDDVYAKVMRQSPENKSSFYIRFTSTPPNVLTAINILTS